MNLPPWEALLDAWQTGYDYAVARVNELADEVTRCPARPAPAVPYETRVAARVALFEQLAAAGHSRRGTREWAGLEAGERVAPW